MNGPPRIASVNSKNGSHYGIYYHSTFQIPASGANARIASTFASG